jgi:hypothetical protein
VGKLTRRPPAPAAEHIARSILALRGHKILLDTELARLYGVPTKRLNEQIRRNRERFPEDFMFQVSTEEFEALRSQFATSNEPPGRGGRRYRPYAFTEHGALMAANVLNSARAIEVSATSCAPLCACARRSPRTRISPRNSKRSSAKPNRLRSSGERQLS